ncbi:flippase [Candidatus Woesearchaeota archaeon]|nr:flippase [Candidatus Woesearchaeota archaeon]
MQTYARTLARGATILLVMSVVTAGLGYLFRLLLARTLSVAEVGLFFAVFGFINMVYSIKSFGIGPALIRLVTEYRSARNFEGIKQVLLSFFIIQFVIFLIGTVLILALRRILVDSYFKDPMASSLLLILVAASFFFVIITTFRVFFTAYQKFTYYSTIELFQALFVLIICAVLLPFFASPSIPAWAYLASFALVAVWCFILMLRIFPYFSVRASITWHLLRQLIVEGVPVTLTILLTSLLGYIDVALLTYFRPLEEVALYSIALPTAQLLRYLPKALSSTLLPVSAEMHLRDPQRLGSRLATLYKYLFVVLVPFSVLLGVFADTIIVVLFGSDYAGAAPAISILAGGAVFSNALLVTQNVILGVGQSKAYFRVSFAGVLFAIAANLALIPRFGILGASVATTATTLIMFLLSMRIIRRVAGPEFLMPYFLKISLIAAGIVFSLLWLRHYLQFAPVIELIVLSAMALVLYAALVLVFRILSLKELLRMLRVVA